MMTPKLGLAGHKVDPRGRTLQLGAFLSGEVAVAVGADVTFGLPPDRDDLGNIELGVCGLAGPGHFCRWEDSLLGRPLSVDTDAVKREYQNFGWRPDDPSTDRGVYALDLFTRWRSVGLFGLPPIRAFAQVSLYSRSQQQAASFCLGGIFWCFNLPRLVRAGSIFEADVWDVADDDGGHAGGHLVWTPGDWGNSWGKHPLITPAFRARYAFDAFTVVSSRGLRDGRAHSGLDLDGLLRAVAAVVG